jgi:hypothetical protein
VKLIGLLDALGRDPFLPVMDLACACNLERINIRITVQNSYNLIKLADRAPQIYNQQHSWQTLPPGLLTARKLHIPNSCQTLPPGLLTARNLQL